MRINEGGRMPAKPRRRLTQADVARLAGVSQATVSLVVSGRAGEPGSRISRGTRERVEAALREHGYAVDVVGRRLAKGRNDIVGVFTYEAVFPADQTDFYHPFLIGIEEEAGVHGVDLLLFTGAGGGERRSIYGPQGDRLRIADGCLLLGRRSDRDELARLLQERFPFVFVGRRESPAGVVPCVGADYPTATRGLVEVCARAGHRRIALLGEPDDPEPTVDRRRGYHEGVAALDLPPVVLTPGAAPDETLDEARRLGATAILVENGEVAEALLSAATVAGTRVPADLSLAVLGDRFDGLPRTVPRGGGAPVSAAPWTSFRIPRREMGAQAMRLLSRMLDGAVDDDDRQVLLPCPLVAGATVAAPAARAARSAS
jgi:DNA-binding LacI/PurR family transcriptional regulator